MSPLSQIRVYHYSTLHPIIGALQDGKIHERELFVNITIQGVFLLIQKI